MTLNDRLVQHLARAMRVAHPDLAVNAELGSLLSLLGALSVQREDVAISLVGGRLFIGRPDERPIDAERVVGTYGVEPYIDDWRTVIAQIGNTPQLNQIARNQ